MSVEYETFFVIVYFLLGLALVPIFYKINKEKVGDNGVP